VTITLASTTIIGNRDHAERPAPQRRAQLGHPPDHRLARGPRPRPASMHRRPTGRAGTPAVTGPRRPPGDGASHERRLESFSPGSTAHQGWQRQIRASTCAVAAVGSADQPMASRVVV
jgi:hypothetical protein